MTSFYEELHKSNVVSDEKENAQSRASVDKWIFRLLLLLIGFMPLIVMGSVDDVVSPLISNIDVLSSGIKGELFTHYKALFLVVITAIAGALLLAKVFFMGGTIRKTKLNYALGVFAGAIIVSTIASPTITVALNGLYNRSDGAISWLCYVALMFIAMNIEYPKKVVNYILYSLSPFVLINLYIITMNFYGKDLLQNTAMQKFMSLFLPEGANISGSSTLVGTLNQWNYMSGMFAIMTVIYFAWAITSKCWTEVVVGAITASASFAVMLMSVSTSGFLTILVAIPLTLILLIKNNDKFKAVTAILIFFALLAPIFHILSEKNERVWLESVGFFIDANPYHKGEESNIDSSYLFEWGNKAYAADSVFSLPELPERSLSFGTGRGYIWSETFNLFKNRPLLGYGNDTLVYNFPHYQLDSRAGLWDENTLVDKPHNVYIGVLYSNGIIGFIALVMIFIWCGLVFLKSVLQKQSNNRVAYVIGIAAIAYMIQAFFNDSLPGITAIAFIFLGMMLTTNNQEAQNNIENI